MQPMKTRTIQDVARPPFPEWYCYTKRTYENSPLVAKLRTKYEIIALGYKTYLPAFLNNL